MSTELWMVPWTPAFAQTVRATVSKPETPLKLNDTVINVRTNTVGEIVWVEDDFVHVSARILVPRGVWVPDRQVWLQKHARPIRTQWSDALQAWCVDSDVVV